MDRFIARTNPDNTRTCPTSSGDTLPGQDRTPPYKGVRVSGCLVGVLSWKPLATLAARPRIAFDDLTAITPAPHPRRAQRGDIPGGR